MAATPKALDLSKRQPLLKVIRAKCLDCCGFEWQSVKACSAIHCPLWRHRLGINPFGKKGSHNPYLDHTMAARMRSLGQDEYLQKGGRDG